MNKQREADVPCFLRELDGLAQLDMLSKKLGYCRILALITTQGSLDIGSSHGRRAYDQGMR